MSSSSASMPYGAAVCTVPSLFRLVLGTAHTQCCCFWDQQCSSALLFAIRTEGQRDLWLCVGSRRGFTLLVGSRGHTRRPVGLQLQSCLVRCWRREREQRDGHLRYCLRR